MRPAAQSNWHPDAVYATFADGTNAVRSKWPCLGDAYKSPLGFSLNRHKRVDRERTFD